MSQLGIVQLDSNTWHACAVLFSGCVGALVVYLTGKYSREVTLKGMELTHRLKLSDYQQVWIENLRDAMAEFHSFGTTPNIKHFNKREFYKAGTKIELLMNPDDEDYGSLQKILYDYLEAKTKKQKFDLNSEFVEICQRILSRESERLKKAVIEQDTIN